MPEFFTNDTSNTRRMKSNRHETIVFDKVIVTSVPKEKESRRVKGWIRIVRVACHAIVFLSETFLKTAIMRVSRKFKGVSCRLALHFLNHVNGFLLSVFLDKRLYSGNIKIITWTGEISSNYRIPLIFFLRLNHLSGDKISLKRNI